MPYKEHQIRQVKYKIQQVSKLIGEPSVNIKYWEEVFSLPSRIVRTGREYTDTTFRTLRSIKKLKDTREYSLFGIAKRLGLSYMGEPVGESALEVSTFPLVEDFILLQAANRRRGRLFVKSTKYAGGELENVFFFKRKNGWGHLTKSYFSLVEKPDGEKVVYVTTKVLVPVGMVSRYMADDHFHASRELLGCCLLEKQVAFNLATILSASELIARIYCRNNANTEEVHKIYK